MLFSLTGLGGFLRSPEGAHVFYSTGVINSLGHMLRLGCQDTASRIPARRETPNFTSKTRGKICEFLFQPGFVAPNWRMLQIPLGGNSMEAVGATREEPAFALLARLPVCSLLSPSSGSCRLKAARAAAASAARGADLCVATRAICGRSHLQPGAAAYTFANSNRALSPSIWHGACPPHMRSSSPQRLRSPTATNLVAGGLFLRRTPPHMAGTGQGRCRARSCSGARLAVIILHFPPHPRPPLRPRAHGWLCPPRPLGRCCAPTPARTKVPPAATDIYSSSCAQNRRAVKGGTILCGARPRARFGTRVAGRCAVGR